jgi:DTW domain-containing protein YfiP
MHPKEFKHTKNGTGHFTHLSLINSKLFVGLDFSQHTQINEILGNPNNLCFVLYPSKESINLNTQRIEHEDKNIVIFLIDSTWPCSRAMLKASPNIDSLNKVSFTHTKVSGFKFKEQPKAYCLSTMESTLCVLELLHLQGTEAIKKSQLEDFLTPFHQMVTYQLNCKL